MKTQKILGVNFFVGPLNEAVARIPTGGLFVAPSGPGLAVDLVRSPVYRAAVQTADLALTDSGWLILLWRLFTGERLPRHSGLKFLREIVEGPLLKEPGAAFWVMPSVSDRQLAGRWLASKGVPIDSSDFYVAPAYREGAIVDAELVSRLNAQRPRVVILAIGGGVQERLGHALRQTLTYRPAILCLGAAIAFLSGAQANIPPWADRMFIGWLLRIAYSPRRFLPRYVSAIRLAPTLWKNRECLPPLQTEREELTPISTS